MPFSKEDEFLVAAAQEGIAAIERGDYVTISNADDAAKFGDEVWAEAMALRQRLQPR